jgi:glutamate--cysteine ligase
MADHSNPVPHLTTATQEPLYQLEKTTLAAQIKIEAWLRAQFRKTPAPFYSSVDLRNAGFKVAPVDTNLFPAGFNNLNPAFLPLAIQAAQSVLENLQPGCTNLILIPENHTRNLFYFESLGVIIDILVKAGFAVRIGSLRSDLIAPEVITLASGKTLTIESLQRHEDKLLLPHFPICVAILNNDLSDGLPEIFKGLKTRVMPLPQLGWMRRLKSEHFQHYRDVAKEFADLIGIDEWFINPLFVTCSGVDFVHRTGEKELAEKVDLLLAQIQAKYVQYGVQNKPYVIVKADAGTYGMGILSVQSGAEILALNRKKRSQMASSKGNQPITQVILQEGVYTFETWEEAIAEPVIYMIGQHVIGGFYRVHAKRGITENLNAPGMEFKHLAFVESCNKPEHTMDYDACPNRFYVYGVIARLASLSAAREEASLMH